VELYLCFTSVPSWPGQGLLLFAVLVFHTVLCRPVTEFDILHVKLHVKEHRGSVLTKVPIGGRFRITDGSNVTFVRVITGTSQVGCDVRPSE
jgi:hypothetical protein